MTHVTKWILSIVSAILLLLASFPLTAFVRSDSEMKLDIKSNTECIGKIKDDIGAIRTKVAVIEKDYTLTIQTMQKDMSAMRRDVGDIKMFIMEKASEKRRIKDHREQYGITSEME